MRKRAPAVDGDPHGRDQGYFDRLELEDGLGLTFPAVLGQLPTIAVGTVRDVL